MPASKARADFAETLDRVKHHGERVVLHRRGKDVAAIVSVEDLAVLRDLEDRFDLAEAKRRLADGRKPLPYAKVRRALGLR